jgi:4-amino-4-deoxy-L-arabinose transferase-like glycosyltransferase
MGGWRSMAGRNNAALHKWALVGILLLAFGLRVYRLGAESLWYDETVSVHLAGKNIPALVTHTAGDIHPPGYYLLLHAWTRLAGSSDFAVAFFSVVFGLLLVALAYRLATRVFGPTAGLLAALLVAISPYNLWYSQEARMYTLGAVLGIGVLSALVALLASRPGTPPSWAWLTGYALCGALGLWTLYYFAFLLVAVNLMVGVWWLIRWRQGRVGWEWLLRWLVAQGAVLLLYAPWIPVAWRQASQPPVPPWRGFTGLGTLLVETWSALSLGQSVEPEKVWPALILVAVLFGLGLLYWTSKASEPRFGGQPQVGAGTSESRIAPWLFAGYVFIPVLLIYLASFAIPLYHVRYAFTYSTPFYVILGAGLAWLGRRWRPVLWLCLAAIILFSGLSIHAYHTDPRYASDDHRAATRFLAEQWRPGDAILVNAGYAYPALVTYWDGDPIFWRGRLVNDYDEAVSKGPMVVQMGTVEGDPSLGWGNPDSDFYALGEGETAEALKRLFSDFHRVWVYRIYDTVTDPDGFVRQWLEEHGTQFEDRVFTGESQLRVQGFLTGRDALAEESQPLDAGLVDGSLQLVATSAWMPAVEVGGTVDLALVWHVASPPGDAVTLFAGLFDEEGQRWAQVDEQPPGSLYPPGAWSEGSTIRTPLRVPVPTGTPPGRYRLEVGWYRFTDGQPIWLPWASGERFPLGEEEVVAPADWSALPRPTVAQPANVTIGSGVRFLGFDAPTLEGRPGDTLQLDLFWQTLEDGAEPGLASLQLADDAGHVLAETSSAPVGGQVPFAGLAPGQTIRDPRSVTLPGGLAPGVYNLVLGRRSRDGAWLPVQRGPLPLGSTYPLATVRVMGRPSNLTPRSVQHPVDARFGSDIRLVGYDLEPPISKVQHSASTTLLALHWQALAPMTARYKIFVHLTGEGGPADIHAQADVYPHLPTTGWVQGEYLSDRVSLELPANLPPGRYSLLMGLYDEATGERLPAFDATGQALGDSLLLEQVHVGE